MPVVRVKREVGTAALPGVRKQGAMTALAEGAGRRANVAEAFGQVGGAIAQQGITLYRNEMLKERENANQTALLKFQNRLSDWRNKRLLDATTGAFTVKGEAAMGLPEQLKAEFNTVAGDLKKDLVTPEQQLAGERVLAQEWDSIDLQVRRHVYTEMQTFRAGELEGVIKNSISAAQSSFLDPKLVDVELSKAVSAMETNGPKLGMGKEQVEMRVRAIQSETHVGVIFNLLEAKKTDGAKEYFKAAKSQISGDQLDAVQKAIDAGALRGRAQASFDQITNQGGSFDEKRTKAKAIADPEERDQVLAYLDHEEQIDDKRKRDGHEAMLRGAFDVLDKGLGVDGITPATWSQMEPNERSAAWAYANQRAAGVPIKTDQASFYNLMTMAGDKPTDFAKVNLLTYRHKLSDSDFQQLAGLQLSIKNGERTGKNIEDLAGWQSKQELINNTLSSYGLETTPSKQTQAQKDAIGGLMRMLDRRIDQAQAPDERGKARKVSNTEVQEILDTLLSQSIDVPGSWWNIWPGGRPGPFPSISGYEKKRLIDVTIDDVPADVRRDLERALRDKKRPVTDQTVLDLYRETQVK